MNVNTYAVTLGLHKLLLYLPYAKTRNYLLHCVTFTYMYVWLLYRSKYVYSKLQTFV